MGKVQNCLISMLGEDMALEQEKKIEVCNVLQQLTESFCVGGGMGADVLAEGAHWRDRNAAACSGAPPPPTQLPSAPSP